MIESMSHRRTPQEKKELSYERDRRNTYGENDKASRKNIPRAKRRAARSYRRKTEAVIAEAQAGQDVDVVDDRVAGVRQKGNGVSTAWRPDIPLWAWLKRKKRS
jgi:hypothetical protein